MPTLIAHFPGIRLDQAELPLAGGRLAHLAFDDWMKLEGDFEFAQRNYEKAAPVFWVGEIEADSPGQDALVALAHRRARDLHTALLLDPQAPLLPTPVLSCMYLHFPAVAEAEGVGDSVLRVIGPLEREFIVYGAPLVYAYTAERANTADIVHRLVSDPEPQDLAGAVRAGIEVLEETARPDSWYGGDQLLCRTHGFVRCMAAAESLLLPPEEEIGNGEITQTFGRQAGALLGPFFEDNDSAAKQFAELYRLRSQLMHGRALPDRQDEALADQMHHGRVLLRNVVYAALLLGPELSDSTPLWRLLQDAAADESLQRRLAATLLEGPGR